MKKLNVIGLASCLAFLTGPVVAGDFDGSKPLLCATASIIECVPETDDGCIDQLTPQVTSRQEDPQTEPPIQKIVELARPQNRVMAGSGDHLLAGQLRSVVRKSVVVDPDDRQVQDVAPVRCIDNVLRAVDRLPAAVAPLAVRAVHDLRRRRDAIPLVGTRVPAPGPRRGQALCDSVSQSACPSPVFCTITCVAASGEPEDQP